MPLPTENKQNLYEIQKELASTKSCSVLEKKYAKSDITRMILIAITVLE